ncbi:hypothetical protein A4A49_32947 [Nicotiana attenuata]|uniref:Uncharacterized protein n=1 Tax=Nicotiana attenuata TaxID=49451 RepID=A0A1J6KPG7_NICAT|nr:hypothetical protein A4A49_32947 [Nicotiana attenuata]
MDSFHHANRKYYSRACGEGECFLNFVNTSTWRTLLFARKLTVKDTGGCPLHDVLQSKWIFFSNNWLNRWKCFSNSSRATEGAIAVPPGRIKRKVRDRENSESKASPFVLLIMRIEA